MDVNRSRSLFGGGRRPDVVRVEFRPTEFTHRPLEESRFFPTKAGEKWGAENGGSVSDARSTSVSDPRLASLDPKAVMEEIDRRLDRVVTNIENTPNLFAALRAHHGADDVALQLADFRAKMPKGVYEARLLKGYGQAITPLLDRVESGVRRVDRSGLDALLDQATIYHKAALELGLSAAISTADRARLRSLPRQAAFVKKLALFEKYRPAVLVGSPDFSFADLRDLQAEAATPDDLRAAHDAMIEMGIEPPLTRVQLETRIRDASLSEAKQSMADAARAARTPGRLAEALVVMHAECAEQAGARALEAGAEARDLPTDRRQVARLRRRARLTEVRFCIDAIERHTSGERVEHIDDIVKQTRKALEADTSPKSLWAAFEKAEAAYAKTI